MLIEDEPYFDRNATCQILGIKDPSIAMRRLSDKGVCQIQVFTKTGNKMKTFINEENLYMLIGRSDKPQAQKFMDWVYDEVLPSRAKPVAAKGCQKF